MTIERYLHLLSMDKNSVNKIGQITQPLSYEATKLAYNICTIADATDLDRRVALKTVLMVIEKTFDEEIMAL